MKRKIAAFLALLSLVLFLTGCNEASDRAAEQMLSALSAGDTAQAADMLHPAVLSQLSDVDGQLGQIISLLDGRQVKQLMQNQSYTGFRLFGTYTGREEQTVYQVILEDDSVWQLQTVYYSGTQSGFATFYLSQPEKENS